MALKRFSRPEFFRMRFGAAGISVALIVAAGVRSAGAQNLFNLPQAYGLRPSLTDDEGMEGDLGFDAPETPPGNAPPDASSPEADAADHEKKPPSLPRLAPYASSALAKKPDAAPQPPPNFAALPQTPAAKPRRDPSPYDPIGFDAGPLRAHAYAETSLGYNANPNQASAGASDARGSFFSRQEFGLSALSNWSNHAFSGQMRLGYDEYFATPSANAPDGAGAFASRIDVSRDSKITLDGNYTLSTQWQTSANLYNNGASTQLSSRPLVATYGGGLGFVQDFNRLELGLRGSYERNYWANAHFADGSTQYLSRDSYDDYGVSLKASYELLPGFAPFVLAAFDQRLHDSTFGSTGYDRNSVGRAFSLGSSFAFGPLWSGSASAGYETRAYADPRLADLQGAIFDISIMWTPTPLTRAVLHTLTSMNETTVSGASGEISRIAMLDLSHDLRSNLTATASFGVENDSFPGNTLVQTYYNAGLKAELKLNRTWVLKGAYNLQRMTSNQSGTDYTANILTLGLRIQQ